MISTADLEVVKDLKTIVDYTVFVCKITCKVIEATAIGFPESCAQIKFVFVIVACFETETSVHVCYEHFAVERLDLNEQLIYRIRLVVNFLICNGSFVFAVSLSVE